MLKALVIELSYRCPFEILLEEAGDARLAFVFIHNDMESRIIVGAGADMVVDRQRLATMMLRSAYYQLLAEGDRGEEQ